MASVHWRTLLIKQWILPSPRASWDCISSSCTWEPMEETPHRQCLPVGQHLLKKSLTLLLCACWGLHSVAHVWGLEDKLMELNLGWQTWQQVPLTTEPSPWPLCLFNLELLCCFCWCLEPQEHSLGCKGQRQGRDNPEGV